MIIARAVALVALLFVGVVHDAHAQPGLFETWNEPAPDRKPVIGCADLRSQTGYDFAVSIAAPEAAAGGAAFCRVEGLIAPEIRFEVSLPAAWNGRLFMFGNGGFAGEALAAPSRVAVRNEALAKGFAVVQTDTGHSAAREPLATFASNAQKLVDYAYRAVHVSAVTAKGLARVYYGAPPLRAYFAGCSTGGRQALISAQRFPEDFDGIVSAAPVLDFTGTMVQYAMQHRVLERTGIPMDVLRTVATRVYETCDALDGLRDGILDDPRQCRFDVATDVPRCASGSTASCLTDAQAAAFAAVYSGVTGNGALLMPGWPAGAEAFVQTQAGESSGWFRWFVGDEKVSPIGRSFTETFFTHMATPGTAIDWRTFDPDRDMGKLTVIAAMLNATDADLARFRSRGGKLLMTFGWADPALNPLMGVGYYERVREKMGAATTDFARLFMMPGVFHCAGGPGPAVVDTLTPLVEWVERGKAPDRLLASRRQQGTTIRTRPLCPYPQTARHTGRGSSDDAANFTCVAPRPGSNP